MMSMRTSCSRNRPTSRAMRMTSAGPCSAASTQSKKSGSLWPVMPRLAPELAHDGVRVGPQRFADGNRALLPDQQLPRDLRVGMIAAGFDHGSVLQEVDDEVGAVGRQPAVVLAGRSLAVGQIPREFFFRGAAFAAQVGFELQDGAAQQGIDPAVDFGDAPLEVDVPTLRPEPIHDEAVEQGTDFLVTGARGEFRDHRGAFVLRQHVGLPVSMPRRRPTLAGNASV